MLLSAVAGVTYRVDVDRPGAERSGWGLCAVLSLPNFRLPRPRSLSLSALRAERHLLAGAGFVLVEVMELGLLGRCCCRRSPA
jgi:hypothetical protein